jgi:hypothetical protein
MKRLLHLILPVLLLVIALPATAQNTCENPFEGEGSIRFSTSYWDQTDFCQHSVPYSEIRSGGPPPDGIPPLDDPQFETVEEAGAWLQPQSPVIALQIEGEAKAYPLAILIWHEIANDTVGGLPVAVTYCPLCNSAIVFSRRVGDETLTFGVSGNLRNSDLIMWDRQTQSWWQQFTGEAIVGVYTGTELTMLPSQIVAFGDFAAAFPSGAVLSRETGFSRSYGTNPYAGYDSAETPFLFEGEIDPRLPTMERVLAGMVGGQAAAYPFSLLQAEGVINDTVGDVPVVAFWQGGVTSALDAGAIDESRDIGTAALYNRTLDGRALTFARDSAGTIRDAETGSAWNVFGEAVEGELAGARLQLRLAAPHLWFAWAAFRPETLVYGE